MESNATHHHFMSRPEPNIRIGYVIVAHSLKQALDNMQAKIIHFNLNIHNV